MEQLPPQYPQTGVFNASDFSYQNNNATFGQLATAKNDIQILADTLNITTSENTKNTTPSSSQVGSLIEYDFGSSVNLTSGVNGVIETLPLLNPGSYMLVSQFKFVTIGVANANRSIELSDTTAFQWSISNKGRAFGSGGTERFGTLRQVLVPEGTTKQIYAIAQCNFTSDSVTCAVAYSIMKIA